MKLKALDMAVTTQQYDAVHVVRADDLSAVGLRGARVAAGSAHGALDM